MLDTQVPVHLSLCPKRNNHPKRQKCSKGPSSTSNFIHKLFQPLFANYEALHPVGVGLVSHVSTGARVGVAGSAVRRRLLVVVDTGGHLVAVAADGGVASSRRAKQLLAAGVGVLGLAATMLGLAAADGEEPEQTSAEGESERDPDSGQVPAVDSTTSSVPLSGSLDSANDDGGLDSSESSSDTDQGGSEAGDEPGDTGDDAREVGENTDNELGT